MDYGVHLGRRFRSLKLWMVRRAFGAEGLAERVRFHVALAQELAGWVRDEPGWEIMAPHPLSLVCFRCAPPALSPAAQDALNERLMHAVNASGEAFLSHTKLRGRYCCDSPSATSARSGGTSRAHGSFCARPPRRRNRRRRTPSRLARRSTTATPPDLTQHALSR